jgi:nucleotide-binding universal stress UspA family protein
VKEAEKLNRGETSMKIEGILVPVDFSPNSLRALAFAVSLVDPSGEIYLLHVIDADFVTRLSEEGFGEAEAATAQLRQKAEAQLQEILDNLPEPKPRMDSMVVIGKPFAEILRLASDLDFEMIVIGTRGRRRADIEEMLFGSTAEKVLRAASVPVVCVPASWSLPSDAR